MMGVIFKESDDVENLLIPYIQKINPEISKEKISDLYLKASVGEISAFRFWKSLGFGGEYPEIEKTYLEESFEVTSGFKDTVLKLSNSYQLAVLSNEVGQWNSYLRKKFELNRFFEDIIISSEVGFRKPDKRVYEKLLKAIQAPPESCVFVDDRLENLRPASDLGIKTVWFSKGNSGLDYSPDYELDNLNNLQEALEVFENA